MPPGTAQRTGNHHTAQRWAAFLRKSGHRVRIEEAWDGAGADVMIALHARKSAESAERFHRVHPERPLIVALTGTDLYRDIETSAEARHAMEIASRLIVLQPRGRLQLARPLRAKTRVVFQSADTRLTQKPVKTRFRLIVVGNLREEKDPFRAVMALARLPSRRAVELLQVGASLSPDMAREARRWMREEPRYRWVGSRAHGETLRLMASSHVLVVSSVMEGGANVICEASRIGVPVLASRVSGNLGMLGADYPGYYPLFGEGRLARLIDRAAGERPFYADLKRRVWAQRGAFAPAAEHRALVGVLAELA